MHTVKFTPREACPYTVGYHRKTSEGIRFAVIIAFADFQAALHMTSFLNGGGGAILDLPGFLQANKHQRD